MKASTQNITIEKTIYEQQRQLVLSFTTEEVQALLSLGGTSQFERTKLLDQSSNTPEQNKYNTSCSILLGEIFHAAKEHLT